MSDLAQPEPKATIFDVQRFCVHDGPGIRTVIFFKRCALDCRWCQNPESLHRKPELTYRKERCVNCGQCVRCCPNGAIGQTSAGRVRWADCNDCGRCAEVCPSGALRLLGEQVTPRELLDRCQLDSPMLRASGGGLTLSGGEPVLHSAFLLHFLPLAKANGFHVVLETAGHYTWAPLEALLLYVDQIYFDWKSSDEESHLRDTGRSRARIRANLEHSLAIGFRTQVRLPIVPGVNTSSPQIEAICQDLHDLGIRRVTLLPYNSLWETRLSWLRKPRVPHGVRSMHMLAPLQAQFGLHGVAAGIM
jgi:pyruvate formate lyase activating enzyme